MQAILLVDHGSRRHESNEQLNAIALLVKQLLPPGALVGVAHMELCEPSIAQAVDSLVSSGAGEIIVVPYLLAPGRHASEDIPRMAAQAAAKHRGVVVTTAACLGVDPLLADLVVRRAQSAGLHAEPAPPVNDQ